MSVTRRQFAATVGALALPLYGQRAMSYGPSRIKIRNAGGEPLSTADLGSLYLCDFLMRTFPVKPEVAPGEARFRPPRSPFRIGLTLPVPGFGHVYVYADNRGRGYTRASFAEPLDLNYELAADRLATVEQLSDELRRGGMPAPGATTRRIERARELLGRGELAALFESLKESLWAGEELVVERARQTIEKRGARRGFLFGCNAFGYPSLGRPYAERFEALFNYATLPFYLTSTEPVLGKPDYSNVEKILSWMGGVEILAKGHPLVWFFAPTTPAWLKGKPYVEVKRLATDYARRSVLRFRHRIHAWDVINEAHLQNVLDFDFEQQIDITRAASEAAREADPSCFRVVNNCCTWNDYMRVPQLGRRNVYDYLRTVLDAGIEFEAIGLQYYYAARDMLEIERSFETFKGFGKAIHITELGVPSSSTPIENPYGQSSRFPWHGEEWSEQAQADWAEQFYTLAFSKPYIDAITWWDLNDPAFIPHGGLVGKDLAPKQAYRRLAGLLAKWRMSGGPPLVARCPSEPRATSL